MAGFSPATIEQVRAANDILEVIGAVLPLKRAGANFVALCPFHKEKTPSFSVNPQKQIFHCFGCHKGGDVFGFVQAYENLSFPEAVRRLAERAKIPLEESRDPHQAISRSIKDALLDLHEQIACRWQAALANDAAAEIARAYLARRAVGGEAVQRFRLGYAPDAWDDTVNWGKSKRFDVGLLEQAGLVIRKEGGGETRYYDRFRGRLMFPICDEQGRVIAFSGRILSGDEKTAKYVNSPETPIFTKGKIFYGLDKAKRALLDEQVAVVCEGQLDLIACHMAGVQNVVAPQGTAFTADHARILKRWVDEVVLCFDSDSAGQSAAVRVLDSLLGAGLTIRVATLPPGHDPDSFIKERGGAAFKQLITQAEGFFDYYLARLCATHDVSGDKGQLAVTRAMAEALRKTESSVLLDKYAQRTALRLGVSPDAMRVEFRKSGARSSAPRQLETSEPVQEPVKPPSAQEFWLLKILMLNDELVAWLGAHLDPAWLQHDAVREVVTRRLAAHREGSWTSAAALLTALENESARTLLSQALAESRTVPNPQQQLSDIVLWLRNQSIDREATTLRHRINSPESSESERIQLLDQLQRLRDAKAQPLTAK